MHITIVTSLYQTEVHLPRYLRHARETAVQIREAGLSIEFILVANEASAEERRLLTDFAANDPDVRVLYVPLETLYASWNRGVRKARGEAIAFWNTDDSRTVEGLIRGHAHIQQGCELVYFAHKVTRTGSDQGGTEHTRIYDVIPYDADIHRRIMKAGPFLMFTPQLYERVGPFDDRFKLVGDFEWVVRATQHTDFCPIDVIAGTFYLHGGNLTDTGNPLQSVEENVVHLLHEAWDNLKPVDPELMRKVWAKWSDDGYELPEAIETQLWGPGAAADWKNWLSAQEQAARRTRIEQIIRYIPKQIIDRTGLRAPLARLGIVKERPPRTNIPS